MTKTLDQRKSFEEVMTSDTSLAKVKNFLTDEEKISAISKRFEDIMNILGLDLTDPSLMGTPKRIAEMYVKEIFSGLNGKNFPSISFFPKPLYDGIEESDNPIFINCAFNSFCEHHFVPMRGKAYIAYIPSNKVIGLSKIPRIVKFFASRPQIQERLTLQIAHCLIRILGTKNVAIYLDGAHFCVNCRGVLDDNSRMTTQSLNGVFKEKGRLREEFFERIHCK